MAIIIKKPATFLNLIMHILIGLNLKKIISKTKNDLRYLLSDYKKNSIN